MKAVGQGLSLDTFTDIDTGFGQSEASPLAPQRSLGADRNGRAARISCVEPHGRSCGSTRENRVVPSIYFSLRLGDFDVATPSSL